MQRSTQRSLLVPQPSVVHAVMSVHAGIMAVGPSAVIAAVKAQKQYLFFHPSSFMLSLSLLSSPPRWPRLFNSPFPSEVSLSSHK